MPNLRRYILKLPNIKDSDILWPRRTVKIYIDKCIYSIHISVFSMKSQHSSYLQGPYLQFNLEDNAKQ